MVEDMHKIKKYWEQKKNTYYFENFVLLEITYIINLIGFNFIQL